MALGYDRAGWPGLLVAGSCFILPSSVATLGLAWVYTRFDGLPAVHGLLVGAKPVMVAIIAHAVWDLGRTACRTLALVALGVICLGAALLGAPPFGVLVVAGGLAVLGRIWQTKRPVLSGLVTLPSSVGSRLLKPGAAVGAAGAGVGLFSIFVVFLKLGVVVFGSGYVLLAFLQADLVDRLHWISQAQLLDAVTAGQLTPGPVFATATFIGYLAHGFGGALLATVGIFLPSFLMAAGVGALAGRLRRSPLAGGFLDGVNAAAVALMASVIFTLGRSTLVDGFTWALGLASSVVLIRYKINATWLILFGAGVGFLAYGLI
jgi:chromate transporter